MDFTSWLASFQQQLIGQNHRGLIVLSGEPSWAFSLLNQIDSWPKSDRVNQNESSEVIWQIYSENSAQYASLTATLHKQNYRYQLGSECDYLVFDGSDLSIDALAALSGTIKAGGICFLLMPIKINEDSFFLQRFFSRLMIFSEFLSIKQGNTDLPAIKKIAITHHLAAEIPLDCATVEQHQAVQAVLKVANSHRDRPLILTADRGRGKSSALAIACAQLLLKNTKQYLVITAPHRQSLEVFFSQLQQRLPQAKLDKNRLFFKDNTVEFLPIDHILKTKPKVNLLLVDEAAAIPVYLLTSLLNFYHRLVFSSTIHGYEGAGRGFTLKFQSILTSKYPQTVKLHVKQAIRWAENDPLEQFIFDTCLLNAELTELKPFNNSELSFSVISGKTLLSDEGLLKQIFSVLVTAHYQTKPSDLQFLLDNANVDVVCLSDYSSDEIQQVVAVALLIKEGHGKNDEVAAVKNSTKRLRDQFLPQSLFAQCGHNAAFDFSYYRVMRIAVHPSVQGQGLGSTLLAHIEQLAQTKGIDFVGASFAANEPLLNYWFKARYSLLRIGFNQDAASGEHSALVLKAIVDKRQHDRFQHNKSKKEFLNHTGQQFYRGFPYLLTDEYQSLSDQLVRLILAKMPAQYLPELTDFDQAQVQAFANKERLYSNSVYSLHLWLLHQLNQELNPEGFDFDIEVLPMLARVLKKRSISDVCTNYSLTGKKALNHLMVTYVQNKSSIN